MTLVLVTGLSAMNMNIFLPSLPSMALYFDTDYRVMQLSVALYLLAVAALQVFIGPISDRFGRRVVLLTSTSLFIVMTVGALFSPNITVFLVFRMGQAVSAAGMVLSRAIVRDMVGQDEAASMIGYVTMGMALVPMVAPAIGGFLDATTGWQGSFWLLIACGVAIFAMLWYDLGETSTGRPASFRAQFAEYPELLSSRRFWGYCLTAAFVSGAFFAYLGGAPFVGTTVFQLEPSVLGLYFGAPAIGYAVGNFISGRYSVALGINRMILIGCSACTIGMALSPLAYFAGLTHPFWFFFFMTSVGLGNGMALPNANAGMLSVRPRLAGTASGLGGAITIGGGAALSALASAVLVPGTGPYPLQAIMLTSSLLALLTALYVIRRERLLAITT